MIAEMASTKKITSNYKQVKKTQKPSAVKKDGAVPSTSAHLLPDANPDLETLKQFDLCLDYGPCIGITRMERWERAHKHGMNPPSKVKDILLKHPTDDQYTQRFSQDSLAKRGMLSSYSIYGKITTSDTGGAFDIQSD